MNHGRGMGAALVGLAAVALAACGGGGKGGASGTGGVGPGASTTVTVGPAGGTVTLSGATLEIPAGALTTDVEISFRVLADTPGPVGSPAAGPVFEIGPDNTILVLPAKLILPWSPANKTAAGVVTVFTAPTGGPAATFVAATTTVEDATHVSVTTTHFSQWGSYWYTLAPDTRDCPPSVCGGLAGYECLNCGFPFCAPIGSKCCGNTACSPDQPFCLDCRATGGDFVCVPEARDHCCGDHLPCTAGLTCISCPNENPPLINTCSTSPTCFN